MTSNYSKPPYDGTAHMGNVTIASHPSCYAARRSGPPTRRLASTFDNPPGDANCVEAHTTFREPAGIHLRFPRHSELLGTPPR